LNSAKFSDVTTSAIGSFVSGDLRLLFLRDFLGLPRIQVSYPNATYLGIWTKLGAGFICIEPWRGTADPVGFSGDFTAKPGVFSVAPGEAQSIEMALTLLGDS